MNTPYVFKKCSKCGRWLVASSVNFSKHKGGKYGLNPRCKECKKVYNKKYNEQHKEEWKKYNQERAEYLKKYREEHKEKIAEYDKKYNQQHKEKRAKYNKKYNQQHKEKRAEYFKKYNQQHKEKRAEYDKKYNQQHKEKRAEYHKKYRETPQGQIVHFNSNVKRRQREEQQGEGINNNQWLEMMKYFQFKCAYSGIDIGGKENKSIRSIDHIIPLAKGGAHEIWNLVPMYRPYNSSKQDKDLEEWYLQQDFYDEDRLNKINEWCEYAYNKWGNKVNTKTI